MKNNQYWLLLLGLVLYGTCAFGQSHKKLQAEHTALLVQMDSMRSSLAEARREWQKCKDLNTSSSENLSNTLANEQIEKQRLSERLSQTEMRLRQLSDTLRDSRAACAQLQASWAAKEQAKSAVLQNANQLQLLLLDSLSDYMGPQLSIARNHEKVYLEIGDSILFGGTASLTPSGLRFLKSFLTHLKAYPQAELVIKGYADPKSVVTEQWKESSRKALVLLTALEQQKFPTSKITAIGKGIWKPTGDRKYKKAPMIIEILLSRTEN